jgi:hypothetical protein
MLSASCDTRPDTIQYGPSGLTATWFQVDGTEVRTAAQWNEIKRVIAYKVDCWAYDLICISFGTAEGAFEVNEEMEGWEGLTEALPVYLPGALERSEWWDEILLPPFAANGTTLFSAK